MKTLRFKQFGSENITKIHENPAFYKKTSSFSFNSLAEDYLARESLQGKTIVKFSSFSLYEIINLPFVRLNFD